MISEMQKTMLERAANQDTSDQLFQIYMVSLMMNDDDTSDYIVDSGLIKKLTPEQIKAATDLLLQMMSSFGEEPATVH